ncbi:hypothetical protein ALC60_05874 [Trachymyrmex zeteki]|uniref:Uncharacterized protein n=1 Tax=Mycetomoellerius zeteki TaxID=64791 RepID=A0A151X4N3_9HYME|nr:hypothetical protein ALC60_05874 [Trachymyrmex zeteki]
MHEDHCPRGIKMEERMPSKPSGQYGSSVRLGLEIDLGKNPPVASSPSLLLPSVSLAWSGSSERREEEESEEDDEEDEEEDEEDDEEENETKEKSNGKRKRKDEKTTTTMRWWSCC